MKKLIKFFRRLIGDCDHLFIVKFEKVPTPEDLPDPMLYRRLVFCARCGEVVQATLVKFTNYGALVVTETGILHKRK